jgi:hypothetical protein
MPGRRAGGASYPACVEPPSACPPGAGLVNPVDLPASTERELCPLVCQSPNHGLDLNCNGAASFGGRCRGQASVSRPGPNAFPPRKGKPAVRRGRKAMGLRLPPGRMVARLPKGWAGEEPVRPQASLQEGERLLGSGDRHGRLRKGLPCFFPTSLSPGWLRKGEGFPPSQVARAPWFPFPPTLAPFFPQLGLFPCRSL